MSITLQQKKKLGYHLTARDRRESRFISVKSQLEKQFKRKLTRMQVRYLEKGIRYQAIYDIETSDFNPYQNFIICCVIHVRDILTGKVKKHIFKITKKTIQDAVDLATFDFDRILLQDMAKIFNNVDQVCGHFSDKFDNRYFTSRCLLTNQTELIPHYQDLMAADTWRMMKKTLKAPRNTLNNLILQATGTSQKTHVDLKYWYTVKFPSNPNWQKAMDYILDHCKKDVKMTVKAVKVIEKFNNVSGAAF